MMTTFAALFGALPLAFGTGEGSELRHPLGITIVGGLIVSQALTLYTTPVVFIYLDNFGKWLAGLVAQLLLARRRGADGRRSPSGHDRCFRAAGCTRGFRRRARVLDGYQTVVRRAGGPDGVG